MQSINMHLLCCDSDKELMQLKSICKSDYIVATGKYSFYRKIKEAEKQVIFLESDEINPYETVWDILDQINHVVDDKENAYKYTSLFDFSYNIEGGFPTRVACMINNLKLIHHIVENYSVDNIFIFDNEENWAINESIFLYAAFNKIPCHIFDGKNGTVAEGLKTLKRMGMQIEDIKNSELSMEEKLKISDIRTKAANITFNRVFCEEEIGILYCYPCLNRKHVQWILKKTKAIGDDVRVICYYDNEAVQKFHDAGIQADCLEDYFSLEDFSVSYQELQRERDSILQQIKNKVHVEYLGIDLSQYLVMKITNYYYRESVNKLYINICAHNYFKSHNFRYIHIWGDSNFWETRICYDNTRNINTKLFYIDMNHMIKVREKHPYSDIISAVFVPNKRQFENSWFGEKYMGRVFLVRDLVWGEKCKEEVSSIKLNNIKTIAILPTGVLSGYTTCYFYYSVLIPIIGRLLRNDFKVILKNHSGYDDCWERDIKAAYENNDKFIYLGSNQSVEDALSECQMVLTDISSVAFDAAAAQKAVFCLVDDQGYDLLIHDEKGFFITKDIDTAMKEIKTVSDNLEIYKRMIEKQNDYMAVLMGSNINMDGLIKNFLHSI